jgi:diguanylate cyclase (GGDEF)-like protein
MAHSALVQPLVVSDLALIDALPSEVALIDSAGSVVRTNLAWQRAERDATDIEYRDNYLDLCDITAARGSDEAVQAARGVRQVLAAEMNTFVMLFSRPGRDIHHWYQLSVTAFPQPGGGAIVMHTDVSTAQYDALTGLPNRMMFNSQLASVVQDARQRDTSAGLLLIDLDAFKPVNDRLGHLAGDLVLAEVAGRLQSCVGAIGLAARFGGDEFAVVMKAGVAQAAAEGLAGRILAAIERPYLHAGEQIALGASAGLALCPNHGRGAHDLTMSADLALYAAKAAGGRCYRLGV